MTLPRPLSQDELYAMGKSIIADIQSAFDEVSIEGGITISEALAMDNYETEEVRREARAQDTYAHWQELDVTWMDPGGSAMSFMDPVGFHFHFPAYLVHDIRIHIGVLTNGHCNFDPFYRLQADGEKGQSYFTNFNKDQRRCCALFLLFRAELEYIEYINYFPGEGETEYILNELYDYGTPFRILHVAWWEFLTDEEKRQLTGRWLLLNSEPL